MMFGSKKIEKLLDYSEDYFISKLGISKEEYLDLYSDYLIEQDGEYYFSKKIDNEFLYNEVIGRYLCSKVNLDTTDLIVEHKGIFKSKILTPNYHDKDYINFRPEDNFEYGMRTRGFDDSYFECLDESLQQDLFKLIAIDLMMEQVDRYARNMEVYSDINDVQISNLDEEFMNSISQDEIFEYLFFLKNRHLSANTRARYLSSIKSFFNYLAVHKKVVKYDPVNDIDFPKTPDNLPVYLTTNEAILLLKSVDKSNSMYERDYCMLTLFLNCGLRLSELVNIDLQDIRTDSTLIVTGKGNKQRLIYLNGACISAINNYLQLRSKCPKNIIDKNALFISFKTGRRLTNRRVEQIVDENIKRAGLNNRGFSTHKLRHTAATLMYQNGVDVRTLKDVLGHQNLSTTQIYTHLNRNQLRNASELNPLAHLNEKQK